MAEATSCIDSTRRLSTSSTTTTVPSSTRAAITPQWPAQRTARGKRFSTSFFDESGRPQPPPNDWPPRCSLPSVIHHHSSTDEGTSFLDPPSLSRLIFCAWCHTTRLRWFNCPTCPQGRGREPVFRALGGKRDVSSVSTLHVGARSTHDSKAPPAQSGPLLHLAILMLGAAAYVPTNGHPFACHHPVSCQHQPNKDTSKAMTKPNDTPPKSDHPDASQAQRQPKSNASHLLRPSTRLQAEHVRWKRGH